MPTITPHLWFNTEAREAAEFYTSFLPDLQVTHISTLHDTPSGDCDIVSFELAGQSFMAISAGPLFTFNPSISFHVKCKTKEEVDVIWEKLSSGGNVLMPLAAYPFSERYGWVADRYGLSWQVMYVDNDEIKQTITPALTFVGDVCGKAEEAINLYTSIFQNSQIVSLTRYSQGRNRTKKEPSSTRLSPWKAWSLARWIAPMSIILPSMKPSLSLCRARRKQKLITTGRSYLLIHRRNNVAGSKTGSASHGRSGRQRWAR